MNSIALLLMTSTIYAVSSDCPNMIEFARGLGMQTARPTIWTALQSDCCNYGATYVYCDGSQRVTQIDWYGKGLYGIINGTAIPSSVTYLILRDNDITGPIPEVLPSGLRYFTLRANVITGAIPSSLPSGLQYLYLHGNQMSGDLPPLPSTLQYLHLGYPGYLGNHFTGTLRLNRPIELYINDNWITDVLVQNSSVLTSWCDLSNNPLLGNQNIAGLTTCTKNGLYSAALLPVTRSTLKTIAKTTTKLTSTRSTKSVDTTTEMTTNIAFGHTNTQQMSSNRMASGRMLSIMMSVTGTSTDISTSSLGTVTFAQEMSEFSVNFGMMLRCIISAMLLTYAMTRTPFKREFKRMVDKGKTTTSGLES